MALSGEISTGAYKCTDGTTRTVILRWSATQNITNNTSTIFWELVGGGTRDGDSWVMVTELKAVIAGTQVHYENSSSSNSNKCTKGYVLAYGKTDPISHNADGTKTIAMSVSAGIYSNAINKTGSANVTLDTIPRSSTITSASNVTAGNNCSITWTPASKSFQYRLKLSLGSWSVTVPSTTEFLTPNRTTAYTYNETQIPTSALSTATSGTATAVLTTYNSSGSQIGSTSSKTFTVSVASTDVPSVGTITLDPENITTGDEASRNILVKTKNVLNISVKGCEASSGSTIKSYTFTGPGISQTISSTDTECSASTSTISQSGTLTYTIKVTDARGKTTSKNATITCYDYSSPTFSSINVYRCNSSGTADNNGTNIAYSFTISYPTVNNTNKASVYFRYKLKSSTGTYTSSDYALSNSTDKTATGIIKKNGTNVTFNANYTYEIEACVIDNYSSITTYTLTTSSADRILSIRPQGKGVAVGKFAETDNLFESKWPVKFNDKCDIDGNLTIGTSTQSSAPTSGITIHDIRNATIIPNSFGNKNANFYFDQIDNRYYSILHMKGGTGNSDAAWELAGNAHTNSNDNTLRYRQGVGDGWSGWQTVLTNQNVSNYINMSGYLPLSGGTLTGKLTLPEYQYYTDSSKSGLDCNNSDIINANGIYFNDGIDSAGEGFNFYRGGAAWDTLYAYEGVLKFHPARTTSGALGGYRVYDESYFRKGICTLSSSTYSTITFTSAFSGVPTVMLTPLTDASGVIPGKVKAVTASNFTAIIGGSAVSSAKFAYLAIYIPT